MQFLKQKIMDNKLGQFIIVIMVFLFLYNIITPEKDNIFWRFPSILASLPVLLNDWIEYLLFDFWPVEIYDPEIEEYEQSTLIKEISRGLSGTVLFIIEFIRELILGGV